MTRPAELIQDELENPRRQSRQYGQNGCGWCGGRNRGISQESLFPPASTRTGVEENATNAAYPPLYSYTEISPGHHLATVNSFAPHDGSQRGSRANGQIGWRLRAAANRFIEGCKMRSILLLRGLA